MVTSQFSTLIMKRHFRGYYRPTEKEFTLLWSNAYFVFDTNVLLDLFRLPICDAERLLEVIKHIKNRLKIPYQVAKEYHAELNNVLMEQHHFCNESLGKLNKYSEEFKKFINTPKNYPFIDENTYKEFETIYEKLQQILKEEQGTIEQLFTRNPIKEQLGNLLDGVVVEPFQKEELQQIYREGEKRYEDKIPPGYEDKKKDAEKGYGDFVIWREMIKISQTEEKPVIFVTSDTKEDWFLRIKGIDKIIGPRPELIDEFFTETKQNFYLYTLSNFLKGLKAFNNEVKIDNEDIGVIVDHISETEEEIYQNSTLIDSTDNTILRPMDSGITSIDSNRTFNS